MNIFIDTNILVSAILFPNSNPDKALQKISKRPYKGFISEEVLEELVNVMALKFPSKIKSTEKFIFVISSIFSVIRISNKKCKDENILRHKNDKPILRAAIQSKCKYILTGDKDFLDCNFERIKCINPSDFLKNFGCF